MSPRSREFMDGARDRLAAARTNLEAGHSFTSVYESYYAMLYAARAALSERDLYAKTHSGTWALFGKTLVVTGAFAPELAGGVDKIRRQRELADYEARNPTGEEAAQTLTHAERFVQAINVMIEG